MEQKSFTFATLLHKRFYVPSNLFSSHSDLFGASASALCMIHCLATPFLFVASAGSATCGVDSPLAWTIIDYAFIGISLLAIMESTKSSPKLWAKRGLWISWSLLVALTVAKGIFHVGALSVMHKVAALSLIVFHLVNRHYCKCATPGAACNT